mmetsp:Transcript_30496/g.59920  ORF Transcript_30496/g.59920 Transcript_30496/m.59920 type:complete len:105 (+) Transcript_30496:67-381(+)
MIQQASDHHLLIMQPVGIDIRYDSCEESRRKPGLRIRTESSSACSVCVCVCVCVRVSVHPCPKFAQFANLDAACSEKVPVGLHQNSESAMQAGRQAGACTYRHE